ncbi:MAG: hypothetical protein J7K15_01925 [Deltaproteobacteria bacterium]|nr:hypothetical protein [Deltaproteobacteria bacterium]
MIDKYVRKLEVNLASLPSKVSVEVALRLYDLGFTVVPIKLIREGDRWKKVPMVEGWPELAEEQDRRDVETYYWNVDGVAILTGVKLRGTDYYVGALDFDDERAFRRSLFEFPASYIERTPRGGFHVIYLTRKKPKYEQYRLPGQRGEVFSVLGETENGKPKLCVIYPTRHYRVINPIPLRVIDDLNKVARKVAEKLNLYTPEPEITMAVPLTLEQEMRYALRRQRIQKVNPRQIFEKIKPYLDIARESSNYYAIHCPFHPPDAHPSFAIYKNTWLGVDFHDMKVYTMKELLRALRKMGVIKGVV